MKILEIIFWGICPRRRTAKIIRHSIYLIVGEDYYNAATSFIKRIYEEDVDVLQKMLDSIFSFITDFNAIFTQTYLNIK